MIRGSSTCSMSIVLTGYFIVDFKFFMYVLIQDIASILYNVAAL